MIMMNQFESFQTTGNKIVVVNKSTITYIKSLPDGNSMIYFNALGSENRVQAAKVLCPIEEVQRILNCE